MTGCWGLSLGGAGVMGMTGPCGRAAVAWQLTQRGTGGTTPSQASGEQTAPLQSEQVPMTTIKSSPRRGLWLV